MSPASVELGHNVIQHEVGINLIPALNLPTALRAPVRSLQTARDALVAKRVATLGHMRLRDAVKADGTKEVRRLVVVAGRRRRIGGGDICRARAGTRRRRRVFGTEFVGSWSVRRATARFADGPALHGHSTRRHSLNQKQKDALSQNVCKRNIIKNQHNDHQLS